jgi:hypothetical protein
MSEAAGLDVGETGESDEEMFEANQAGDAGWPARG